MAPVMSASGLQVVKGGRTILDVGEFELNRGETLGVVGPNGSGKSTLVKVLAFLERPWEGKVVFQERTTWSRREGTLAQVIEARRSMAVVFQDPTLLDGTVYHNVGLPLKLQGVPREERIQRVDRCLELFGIAHLASRHARHLSGGEAQRAALARAFVVEPEVLFLDEPFASLDLPTKKRLIRDLSALLERTGISCVMVSHDVAEVSWFTNRVIVLQEGKVTALREIPRKLELGAIELWS